jgi:mono/diheme cytochrome c family protein
MLKPLLIAALVAALAAGTGFAADQSNSKVILQVGKTAPSNGKQMFAAYCSPCHGVDGRGNGPVASALRTPPADLTLLRKINHGKFPDTKIVSMLEFGVDIPSHGSIEMPVWGPILGKMDMANDQERVLRISNLSRYVDSLQTR